MIFLKLYRLIFADGIHGSVTRITRGISNLVDSTPSTLDLTSLWRSRGSYPVRSFQTVDVLGFCCCKQIVNNGIS